MKKYLFALAALSSAFTAWATPPNQPVLDGRPLDYDAVDLRGTFTGGGGAFGAGVGITNLYVTWDTNYLYLALQGFESDNKLVILLDVDPTNAVPTGATTTTNWVNVTPDFIRFNDVGWKKSDAGGATAFGLDYLVTTEGFYNNTLRILYDGLAAPDTNNVQRIFDLADAGNGATPQGTPVDMAAFTLAPSNELTGFEAKIPWSVIYGANTDRFGVVESGEIVPRGALLRMFANIHNNNSSSSFSANDAIPQQTSGNASYGGGLLTSDNYVDVQVDGDGDGIPDIVGGGDVNAPFIRFLQGAVSARAVYAQFNEALNESTAIALANWSIAGNTPGSITLTQTNGVLMLLTNDLPAAGAVVQVSATGVQDESGNTRSNHNYLTVAGDGLSTSVTVRFLLETASGLGVSPGATNFFINGGGLPLEFGFPPATSSPLSQFTGTMFYRDVTFPPGTPVTLNYKYSGILDATGTNTYEAVRLVNYADAARQLTLDTNGVMMVITDYLGAAAAPYRPSGSNTAFASLYSDGQRGDAGVRERITMTFQLDLRNFSTQGVSRVLVQGTDPLRGFNTEGTLPVGIGDFAGSGAVGWNVGGVALFDNGMGGDTNAGDKLFARTWSFTTDGSDSITEPGFPYSLVGGDSSQPPYNGFGWANGRSPRSFKYRYYVYNLDTSNLANVSGDIEYYIQGSPTNIDLPVFAWDNNGLPPPPPTNAPYMVTTIRTGANTRVLFGNVPSEVAHGVEVSTNMLNPWLDYGQRAAGAGGNWTALVQGVGATAEFFRAFAGPARPQRRYIWTPNPIPATGATVSIYYNQHSRVVAGQRDLRWFGRILSGAFTNKIKMNFVNDGGWTLSLPVPPATNNSVEFLFTDPIPTIYGKTDNNLNFIINVGGRTTWTPEMPTQGGLFSITYNSTGGVLAAATQLFLHIGFDNYQGQVDPAPQMTNMLGTNLPGIWEATISLPPVRSNAVDWVFKNNTNGGTATFDNNSGLDWRAFIFQP